MPNPQNPDIDQVPTPEEGATGEELNKLTPEEIAKKSPEELLELYNNAIEMRKAATQRNMQLAEERRKLEAEREFWMKERERQQQEIDRIYEQMRQLSQMVQPSQTTPPPSFEEMTPEQAYSQLLEELKKTREEMTALKREVEERTQKLYEDIVTTQGAIEYREFLKEKVFPKYKYVTKEDIDDWFTEHPTIEANPKTVIMAAEEIQKAKEAEIEALVQERLKEKEKLAQEGDVGGSPFASLPPGKSMIDLPESEQAEILRKDIEKLMKMR